MLLSRALRQSFQGNLIDLSSINLEAKHINGSLNLAVVGPKRAADNPSIFESRVGQFVKTFASGFGHS